MGNKQGYSRLMAAVGAAALAIALVTALGSGPAGAAGASGPLPAIAWHRCPANSAASIAGGFLPGSSAGAILTWAACGA